MFEDSNPFVGDLWTPLRQSLAPQENFKNVPLEDPIKVDVPINVNPVETLKPSHALLGMTGPHNFGPSHTATNTQLHYTRAQSSNSLPLKMPPTETGEACLLYTSPSPRD